MINENDKVDLLAKNACNNKMIQIQVPINRSEHMEIILDRLRTGHNRLNMHLHNLGLHNSGLRYFCEEPETVKHYLLDCMKYQHLQENLMNFVMKNNIKLTI